MAVISQSLINLSDKYHPNDDLKPCDFEDDGNKLYALDYFREGHITNGLIEMQFKKTDVLPNRYITPYDNDPTKFKEEMLAMAYDLEQIGL